MLHLMQLLLPKEILRPILKPLVRLFLGVIAIPIFRQLMRKFVDAKAIDEELEKDLEQWFRGALLLLIASENMEGYLWGWLPAAARDTPFYMAVFMAGRLLLAIGVVEGMPDQALFSLIHPGPQRPVMEKGQTIRSLIRYIPQLLKGLICQHLNRSSPVFAILCVFQKGEIGWICYGMAITQYLIIGLVSSKDKALDVLSQFDEVVAQQRHDIEMELNQQQAARKAAEAQLKAMDPNIDTL